MKLLMMILLVTTICPTIFASESIKKKMAFTKCKKTIAESQSQFGPNHRVIVNTNIMYMAKTVASNADILFTCIKKDNELIITQTPH